MESVSIRQAGSESTRSGAALLRRTLTERAESAFYRAATACNERLSAYWRAQPEQLQLFLELQSRRADPGSLPTFADAGFRTYSQFDEDGLLLLVLAIIGMGSRRCVDIGCGKPMGSNTTNLIANWRWRGLCIDGDPSKVRAGTRWYARHRATMFDPPRLRTAIVSPGNINALLAEHGFADDVDVLSLDIDGIDYWVWNELMMAPRVVVVEFNQFLPAEPSVTVPMRDPVTSRENFQAHYAGASLEALVRLGRTKGYRFVGVSAGVNAFFVRESEIPERTLAQASVVDVLSRPVLAGRNPPVPDPALMSHDWFEV